ncbi:MAG: hypothetical protein AB2693_14035, partial [Candidatus Thiodiazotropha sp.]
MKICQFKSDGLGGFSGVLCSLGLGSRKRISNNKFYLVFIALFLTYFGNNYTVSCLSLILDLQRSNEAYKNIKFPYTRCECIPSENLSFSRYCLTSILVSVPITWLFILIVVSGDVEVNPGPGSVESDVDSNINSSSSSYQMLSNHLSIFHLNIQSILPKLDLIKAEADAYDVLVFSESWLKPDILNDSISIANFMPPFRKDRCDRMGGGVIIYVRDSFLCKRRCDLELRGLEAVWVEIQVRSKKILVGGFYRPPNSNNSYSNLIEESI